MNAKMKVLSLALVGLCGYAGSALAVCPTDPAQPIGAWTSKSVTTATWIISTPGLASTACKLDVAINVGAFANAKVFVTDDSPVDEPRYRARFYFNIAALTGLTLGNQQTKIFNASATTGPALTSPSEVTIGLLGGTPTNAIRMLVANATQPNKFTTVTAVLPASASGTYYVEFDLTQGASTPANNFRYWVADAATATSDASPTGTATVDTTGWSGVTTANLGLFGTSAAFRAPPVGGQVLSVDQFDSRRQTFIGQ
jgi:hypothetical protein